MTDYVLAKDHYLRNRNIVLMLPYLYEYFVHKDPQTSCTKEQFIRLFPVWLNMPVMNLETGKVYPDKNRAALTLKIKDIFNFLDEKYLK